MLSLAVLLLLLVALSGPTLVTSTYSSGASEGFSLGIRDSIMIAHSFSGEEFGPAQALHGATYTVDVDFCANELVDKCNWVIDIGKVYICVYVCMCIYVYICKTHPNYVYICVYVYNPP
jgi:hypothetical protein